MVDDSAVPSPGFVNFGEVCVASAVSMAGSCFLDRGQVRRHAVDRLRTARTSGLEPGDRSPAMWWLLHPLDGREA